MAAKYFLDWKYYDFEHSFILDGPFDKAYLFSWTDCQQMCDNSSPEPSMDKIPDLR